MAELKCPHCGQNFTVDDAELASITNQIRDNEFYKELHQRMEELKENQDTVIKSAVSDAILKERENTDRITKDLEDKLTKEKELNSSLKNEIDKEMHKGEKDYVSIVAKALENAETYEALLLDMVENAIATKSAIYELTEDQAMAYIQKKLNVGKKASEQILENYYSYGGESKWHLVNAITDYAHMDNLDTRIQLEEKAFKVA